MVVHLHRRVANAARKRGSAVRKPPRKGRRPDRPNALVNPLRVDPTRTVSLRSRFAAEVRRMFQRLKAKVLKLVLEEDAFGLTPSQPLFPIFSSNRLTTNVEPIRQWQFKTTPEKVAAFKEWL